jgi:hypothetical protein
MAGRAADGHDIEVLRAQHKTMETEELLNAMFNIGLVPVVDETAA